MWYCCNLIIKKAVISGFEKKPIVLLNGDNASATFFNWLIMDFVCKKKFKKNNIEIAAFEMRALHFGIFST